MQWEMSNGLEGLDHNFLTGKIEDLVKWAAPQSVAGDLRPGLLRHRDDGHRRRPLRPRPLRHGGLPGLAPPGRPHDRGRPGVPEDGPGAAPDLRPDDGAQVGHLAWACAPAAAACSTTTPSSRASTRSSRSTCTRPAARPGPRRSSTPSSPCTSRSAPASSPAGAGHRPRRHLEQRDGQPAPQAVTRSDSGDALTWRTTALPPRPPTRAGTPMRPTRRWSHEADAATARWSPRSLGQQVLHVGREERRGGGAVAARRGRLRHVRRRDRRRLPDLRGRPRRCPTGIDAGALRGRRQPDLPRAATTGCASGSRSPRTTPPCRRSSTSTPAPRPWSARSSTCSASASTATPTSPASSCPRTGTGHPLRKDYAVGRIPVQFKGAAHD